MKTKNEVVKCLCVWFGRTGNETHPRMRQRSMAKVFQDWLPRASSATGAGGPPFTSAHRGF